MNERQRKNLQRLLRPRHVAVIGGRDAEVVAAECARIGFSGPFWPVNPKRAEIGGHRCHASVDTLPEAPDAVYLAIPREAAIETVARLRDMGAGGVVCYTAGFGETGADGAGAEARLMAAAGDMALVGPNCYGIINYVDRVALWPFAHGGACPGYGAAIITQSGMLSSDFTMSQRAVPFAYMVSAGNQTQIHLEHFIDVLSDHDEVRAFGLHIEGLRDVAQFERSALRALKLGKPIVALKTGSSALGSRLTVSHTGSLSGTEEVYDAFFERLGIIRVTSPAQLLETVKLLSVAGIPEGRRIAGLTCSGGGATMLADHAERVGLDFPLPSDTTAASLRQLLPQTATVSNPLDYTTPIWGIPEKTAPVFRTLFAGSYDSAVIVQDYPAAGLDESKPYYRNDTVAFLETARERGLVAAVCSTLPENLDAETRDFLVRNGVAPMQGIEECLNAFAHGAWFHARREKLLQQWPDPLRTGDAVTAQTVPVDEARAKAKLAGSGIVVPHGIAAPGRHAAGAAERVGFPVALKMVSARLPHKTEAGAVRLGLRNTQEVGDAVLRMAQDVAAYDAAAATDTFLLERMAGPPIVELMVGIRRDPQFGYAMTLASGGVLVELLADAVTLLLPASRDEMNAAVSRLRLAPLLDGYRGKPAADRGSLLDTLERLAAFAMSRQNAVVEIEINPLFVMAEGTCAVDVLLQVEAFA